MLNYPLDMTLNSSSAGSRRNMPLRHRISTRRREAREIPPQRETHFGDQEREDLTEIATIATLEIAPIKANDGWLLSVVVEDEAGPRVSDTNSEVDQQIDVGTFYNEFIRTGRGVANVVAEVEVPAAKARVTRLIHMIEKDLHKRRGSSKAS